MDTISQEFARELRERLGLSLREVRLFGSRARGDASEDSDYDMLVIVDRRTPDVRAAILEIEVSLMDRYGVLISSLLRSESEWEGSKRFPLGINIAKESRTL